MKKRKTTIQKNNSKLSESKKKQTMYSKNAAITIISKNYFSYAKTLAESFKKNHPDNDFIIVLADRYEDSLKKFLPDGVELIEIDKIQLPDFSRFIYHYTIMELNTAVKPYALKFFFETRDYETLLYIDPDIMLFNPLTEIYNALDAASIVLIPHTNKPFYDNHHPSDISILQSGTYNLGFLGLKNGKSSKSLLEWWMTKLYLDCIVDIPKGLFVDQKWIDFAPAFFPDHKIIYNPGYNVAYWNLHERTVTIDEDNWLVNGAPLAFFHFSGYSPFFPKQLSKHQNRFQLSDMPDLKKIFDFYGEKLLSNGFEETNSLPYAFENLSNGVKLPISLVRDIVQFLSRHNINMPDPIKEPDNFCKFLMLKGNIPENPEIVLLFYFLLKRRSDVAAAYPNVLLGGDDKNFRDWLVTSGKEEEGIKDILSFEDRNQIVDYVADGFKRLRKDKRADVFNFYKNLWVNKKAFDHFAEWFTDYGIKEMDFSEQHTNAIKEALGGISQILNIYFLRGDLQIAFRSIKTAEEIQNFVNWLVKNRFDIDLSLEDISIFAEFAKANSDLTDKMRFLYQHFGKTRPVNTNIFQIDDVRYLYNISLETKKIAKWLYEEGPIEPVDHYISRYGKENILSEKISNSCINELSPKENFNFFKKINSCLSSEKQDNFILNFASFLTAPSGMGESSRSMFSILKHTDSKIYPFIFPHPRFRSESLPINPAMFGWPSSRARISVTVANADCGEMIKYLLPSNYWASKNVGFWVWETEKLPLQFKKFESLYDEIWAPSQYSCDAIRKTVECNVRVLPHTLDFYEIDKAKSDRKKFSLPEEGTLLGFIFDPHSILERKNISGLIRAFRMAFRNDDKCYLILKVNGKAKRDYDYELVRSHADCENIIFIENTMTRLEVYDFIKSLDVYVSLHRSEGFGLTCAEAMALGVLVIASDYSGNLEFMNKENSLLVPTKVIETERSYGPYPSGTRWGEPDIESAVAALRNTLNNEFRSYIAEVGSKSVRISLDSKILALKAKEFIDNILSE